MWIRSSPQARSWSLQRSFEDSVAGFQGAYFTARKRKKNKKREKRQTAGRREGSKKEEKSKGKGGQYCIRYRVQ